MTEQPMKITGIIAEYNPFHNGHQWQILEARRRGATHVVAVMGGDFLQRGAPALMDKRLRAAAALAGGADLVLELPLPGPLASATSAISKVATPLGLMVLGGSFSFSDTKGFLRQLVICVTGRLIVVPALWLSVAALLGFRDLAIITLLPLFASPVATSSFAMAQQMDGDSDLAGQLVVYTSIFSIFTMFFWIVILKNLALF